MPADACLNPKTRTRPVALLSDTVLHSRCRSPCSPVQLNLGDFTPSSISGPQSSPLVATTTPQRQPGLGVNGVDLEPQTPLAFRPVGATAPWARSARAQQAEAVHFFQTLSKEWQVLEARHALEKTVLKAELDADSAAMAALQYMQASCSARASVPRRRAASSKKFKPE